MGSAYFTLIFTNKISAQLHSGTLLFNSSKLKTAQTREESVIRSLENITVKKDKELGSVRLKEENFRGLNTL